MIMTAFAIIPSDDVPTPGDLHARVIDGQMLLPAGIARRFQREGVRTADDLLAYMQAFPSAVAELLQWQPMEVHRAATLLENQLGTLPRQVGGWPSGAPPLGAFDPDELPD
jgi:hypothetical protein